MSVDIAHCRHDDLYVTRVSYIMKNGNFEFSSVGPDGKTVWSVTLNVLTVSIYNISVFVKMVNLSQNDIPTITKVQFTVEKITDKKRKLLDDDCWNQNVIYDKDGHQMEFVLRFSAREWMREKDVLVFEVITRMKPTEVGELSHKQITNDLDDIYNNKDFSDVILICGNSKFQCHKVFLATRSPVFKAMLTVDMKEKNSGEVHIKDVAADVMEELLQFIYKGKSSNFDKYVTDLLFAADKYQIDSLKEQCEKKLISSIESGNCFSLLIIGDTCSQDLKKSASEFLIKNRASIEYKDSLVNHPSLMNELLSKVFTKRK